MEGKNFSDFGLKEQSAEFYEEINSKFNEMDDMDMVRCMLYLSTQIINTPRSYPPIVIFTLMEKLQEVEMKCSKLKEILGATILTDVTCKKCGKVMPKMTIQQHLEGVNKDCPHDSIEVDNSAIIEHNKKAMKEYEASKSE